MKLKKTILITVLSFSCLSAFSQTKTDPKWSNKYHSEELKGTDLVRLIEEVDFKLAARKVDIKTFKTAILQLSPDVYAQINIDSWYLCSTKHDDYFEIWNMYYTKVSREKWDAKCKGLMALMCLDGTATPPKPGD